jgi:hypothetical protein
MPKCELFSVPPGWANRFSFHNGGNEALALPFLRKAFSRETRRDSFFPLRTLPAMRKFRSGAHCARSRRRGNAAIPEAPPGVPRLSLRSLPPTLFQRASISPHSSIDCSRGEPQSSRRAGQSFQRVVQLASADWRCRRKRRTDSSRSSPIAILYASCASSRAPDLASSSARAAQ